MIDRRVKKGVYFNNFDKRRGRDTVFFYSIRMRRSVVSVDIRSFIGVYSLYFYVMHENCNWGTLMYEFNIKKIK